MLIQKHEEIYVLRDDTLIGGTKSILLDSMLDDRSVYVYASPVYGGFQIALAAKLGPRAVIFCAKRAKMHENTLKCIEYGATVIEIKHGYLSVVDKAAREYCEDTGAIKLKFGAHSEENIDLIAARMRAVTHIMGHEPEQIWCAVGSGTLIEGILKGTTKAQVSGVVVGMDYENDDPRVRLFKYHRPFEVRSMALCPFQSMPNYDLKAWEYCQIYGNENKTRLFWNVL